MRKPRSVWKGFAIINAVLLAGALIAYKAGAFAFASPQPDPFEQMSGSKSIRMGGLEPETKPQPTTRTLMPEEFGLMAGSKVGTGIVTIEPGASILLPPATLSVTKSTKPVPPPSGNAP